MGAERVDGPDKSEHGKKRERSSVETKRRILEAATAELAAKGFDGARLGSIARAADVQQALIHHYFTDKEGLRAEVVKHGLAAMTAGVWDIMARMDEPPPSRSKSDANAKKKKRGESDIRALAEAFVDLLLRFFAANGAFLAILRHEARRGEQGAAATGMVVDTVRPVFEGVAARLEAMSKRGELRRDVDARHIVLSVVAMVAFPFEEAPFVAAIWPVDWHDPAFLDERKRHIVDFVLSRVLP